MKDSLQLKKFKTENINGTFNIKEEKSFFGTKLMDIEDELYLTDKSIQYLEVYKSGTTLETKNNGYQYSEINLFEEKLFLMDIVTLKYDNHTIKKSLQLKIEEEENTRWEIDIDIKQILIDYLFAKIKKARTFKSLSFENFSNKNINKSIKSYIFENIIDRYEFVSIDLFIKYIDIENNHIYETSAIKQYDPLFNQSIGLPEYKISNSNIELDIYLDKLAPIKVNYFQTKSSLQYKFDYYFNLKYRKI